MSNRNKGINFINLLPGMLMMIAALVVIYYVATGIYAILSYIAVALFVVTAIVNHRVILDYGKLLINTTRRNPIAGIIGIGLTVFFYPIVALFLFGKAMFLKKVDELKQNFETRTQGEFVEYEEVENKRPQKPEIIELPPLKEKQKQTRGRNDYEDLFEE
ncbi:MAG: hypothetical protein AAF573_02210 [Bacteroidota bacterium]